MNSLNNIKVSIIVPVFESEDRIRKCIMSILDQTYKSIELVLVDDGSLDSSGKICDEYSKLDSRVRVFHTKNYGVAHARNVGLKHATGDYIGFCDSDDYYNEKYVSELLSAAVSYTADITISGYSIENNGIKNINLDSSRYISKTILFKHFTLDTEIGGFLWNKLFKREVLIGIWLPENVQIMEDTIFLCKVLERVNKIYYLAQPLYNYCDNEKSITNNWDKVYLKSGSIQYIESWYRILDEFELNYLQSEYIRVAIFETAINFKYYVSKEKQLKNKKLVKYLNKNIKKHFNEFCKCKDVSFKNRLKYILKLILSTF